MIAELMLRYRLQSAFDRFRLRLLRAASERQFGAVPFTVVDGHVVFLMITSRRTGRWIFPKGSAILGKASWQVAQLEALEEAGVEGDIEAQSIGTYQTIKKRTITQSVVEVEMYPLRVTRQHDAWQEQVSRHRHWALLPEARRLLSDPKLADIAAKIARREREAIETMAVQPAKTQNANSPSSR